MANALSLATTCELMTFPKLAPPSLDKLKDCLYDHNKKHKPCKWAYNPKWIYLLNNTIWKHTHAPQNCNLMTSIFFSELFPNQLMSKILTAKLFWLQIFLISKVTALWSFIKKQKNPFCLMQWPPLNIKLLMSLLRKRTRLFLFSQSTGRRKAKQNKNVKPYKLYKNVKFQQITWLTDWINLHFVNNSWYKLLLFPLSIL